MYVRFSMIKINFVKFATYTIKETNILILIQNSKSYEYLFSISIPLVKYILWMKFWMQIPIVSWKFDWWPSTIYFFVAIYIVYIYILFTLVLIRLVLCSQSEKCKFILHSSIVKICMNIYIQISETTLWLFLDTYNTL